VGGLSLHKGGVEVQANELAEGLEQVCELGRKVLVFLVVLHPGDDLGVGEYFLLGEFALDGL